MKKRTILFLAANPLGTDRIALDREARAIQTELERSSHRDQFELVTRWAAQPLDLLRELRKLKPTVVHFSGHGGRGELGEPRSGKASRRDVVSEPTSFGAEAASFSGDHVHGLFFQGPDDRPQLVSTAALEETFGAAGSSVKLVVLNACYSEAQARALLAHVDCVVGMGGSISNDAARNFATGFYGGMGECESIAAAYQQGRAAIGLEGLPDGEQLQLKVRDGIDADQLVLAEVRPESMTAMNAAAVSSGLTGGLAAVPSEPLSFAVIAIDARDRNWGTGRSARTSPFKYPAYLHFRLVEFVYGADPLFDITLVNVTDTPTILTAIGVNVIRVAQTTYFAGIPTAARIPRSDSYVLDIPDIRSRQVDLTNFVGDFGPRDIAETIRKDLPDPIYLEPRAPYRYGLLLRYYATRMPNWARICMCLSTDKGECHSDELEISSR